MGNFSTRQLMYIERSIAMDSPWEPLRTLSLKAVFRTAEGAESRRMQTERFNTV